MAKIGMRYPVYRKMTITTDDSGNETITYGDKKVMGKAVSSNVSVNYTEATLYGDDGVAETVRVFADGTLTIVTDDLEDEVEEDLLGATIDENGDIINSSDDNAPWVEIGYILVRMRHNVTQYRGVIYPKVQFVIPSEDYQTKGESITFGTPSMSGTMATDEKGRWRRRCKWKTTAAEAQEWLDTAMSST